MQTFHLWSTLGYYCVIILDLCGCQLHGGGKWSSFSQFARDHSAIWSAQAGNQLTPQIHSPQTKLTVQVGDDVQLPCSVHNLGQWQVLWKKGTNILAGSNITTYGDERIHLLKDFTLKISNITQVDQGDYECIVTTSWTLLSIVHSVVVYDAPTVSLLTPTNIIIAEGETVEIGCIPQGNPLPRINWSMRDGIIPVHKSLLNNSKISLEKVTRHFTGLYVCTASNGIGRPAIGAVYVRVLFAPEIEIPRRRVHGGIGYKFQLVALVHGDPKPEIRWRKEEESIKYSDRVYIKHYNRNEYHLIIESTKPSDFATYTIEAQNMVKEVYYTDIKKIEFTGVPSVPIISRWEREDVDGIQVTLFWTLECFSFLIDYKLFFRPFLNATIPHVDEENSTSWIQLTIPADSSPDANSFLHTKSFTLGHLEPSSIYEVTVKARNKFGWGQLSPVCYFATFPNSSNTKTREMEIISPKNDEGDNNVWLQDKKANEKHLQKWKPSTLPEKSSISASTMLSLKIRWTTFVFWVAFVHMY